MDPRREVEEFLARWARAHEVREAEGAADLFVRDPDPLVTFSDGERARDWLDVRVRLVRDLSRAIIERVEVHDIQARALDRDTLICSYLYDMTVRDPWGTSSVATRFASMTLVRTKDGLRIAAAHFAVAR